MSGDAGLEAVLKVAGQEWPATLKNLTLRAIATTTVVVLEGTPFVVEVDGEPIIRAELEETVAFTPGLELTAYFDLRSS